MDGSEDSSSFALLTSLGMTEGWFGMTTGLGWR